MISIAPSSEPTFEDALRHAGFRVTRPRRAILDVLSRAEASLKPEEVQHQAVAACPGIGLVTVYRTLSLLTALGCVRRIHQADHCYGYARASLDHSHHLICRECEQVIEFAGSENIGAIIGRVSRETGFRIDGHLLELMGVCPDCQGEAAKRRRPTSSRRGRR